MRLRFASDATRSLFYGVFIDDMAITAEPLVDANLTWASPPFWSQVIVPSGLAGTTIESDIFGGETTFVDWAVQNTGTGNADNFHVGLYLDGSLLNEWSISTLNAGATFTFLDYLMTASTGGHSLKLIADNRDEVAETNESDNIYEHFFYWAPPEITYTGIVNFWDMNPQAALVPATDVLIQLLDRDGMFVDTLAETTTGSAGYFTLGPVSNIDDAVDAAGSKQDIIFQVFAKNSACSVLVSSWSVYRHSTLPISQHPSGVFNTNIDIDQDTSGAFFMADVLRQAREKWMIFRPDPGPATAYLAFAQSAYDTVEKALRISKLIDATRSYPDTYDEGVILHEYGHWLSDIRDFFTNTSGPFDHTWCSILQPDQASNETWADFWAAYVLGNPTWSNRWNNYQDSFWVNLETGEIGDKFGQYLTANALATNNEGASAGILWDIYDNANDEHSSRADWGDSTLPHTTDGIGDTLDLDISDILTVLIDRQVNGHQPNTMDEFWDAWFQNPSLGHLRAMQDIWYEHGDSKGCCVGMRGDINGVDGETPNVSDMTYLIDNLFRGGPVPACPEEADIVVDGNANISDLTKLIDFVFRGGPAPPQCP